MIKLLLIFGTRPEAIKMAPVIKTLKDSVDLFNVKVCVTAQHRDLLDQVLSLFKIVPDYDLNIMKPGQDLYDITSRVLLNLRDILLDVKPDAILVHGDTTTSMAASMAAFYAMIPVFHVEAGLRTGDIYSPWPEEINRQITSRIASLNFSPTSLSKENLLKENVESSKIEVVGNSVIDALHLALTLIANDPVLQENNKILFAKNKIALEKQRDWQSKTRKLVLITGHRRENFGTPFLHICQAIKELTVKYPDVDFVYPVHPNPHVKEAIVRVFGEMDSVDKHHLNLIFCSPLDYLPFISLMNLSYLVLTDSGGIQEEAPSLGKPVLVMRDTTERPEGVNSGTVKLVGTNKNEIIKQVSLLLDDKNEYDLMKHAINPYGDGQTSTRIKASILSYFKNRL